MSKFILFLTLTFSLSASAASEWKVSDPCTKSEQWKFAQADHELLGVSKSDPMLSFSEAMSILKHPSTTAQRAWAEYWISRTFFQSGLLHLAHFGMNQVMRKPEPQGVPAVYEAAMGCLLQIHSQVPSLEGDPTLISAALMMPSSTIRSQYLLMQLEQSLARSANDSSTWDLILRELPDASDEKRWANALIHSRRQHYSMSAQAVKPWFETSSVQHRIPKFLSHREDTVRMIYAHALYGMGNFDQAVRVLQSVRKQSNELGHALSDLAWSALMVEKHSDAIGVAASLQTGAMRRVYTPESPMVMAMAFTELCQYPEALKAAQLFRKRYETSYHWLEKWNRKGSPERNLDLRMEAIHLLKKQPSSVPEAVAGEWIRSPLFLFRQDEINRISTAKNVYLEFSKLGIKKQRVLLKELRLSLNAVRKDYAQWKKDAVPGAVLPETVKDRLDQFRDQINQYGRLKIAGLDWKRISAFSQHRLAVRKSQIQDRTQRDLASLTQRMYMQLEEITDNMQLVEVEIYNGASQDMVWQNAHPDHAKNLKKAEGSKDSGWSWGQVSWASEVEDQEVWEDELGGLQANLKDRCSTERASL